MANKASDYGSYYWQIIAIDETGLTNFHFWADKIDVTETGALLLRGHLPDTGTSIVVASFAPGYWKGFVLSDGGVGAVACDKQYISQAQVQGE
jgi:hypothetical protein